MWVLRWLLLALAAALAFGQAHNEPPDEPEDQCCDSYHLASSHNGSVRIPGSLQNSQANGDIVQRIPGLRPGSFRYHIGDGFFYHHQRTSSGRMFLRCVLNRSNPPCHVRAVMNSDLSGFMVTGGEHNHAPDEHHERVHSLRSSLLEACRVRPNVRVDLIYHDVCRNVPREVSSRVSLLSIRPSMIRTQAENRPNIPHTFEALDALLRNSEELSRTLDSQTHLYQGMTGLFGHRSLLFMSRRILEGAGDIRHVFGDATFYARPNLPESAQLYTLVTVRDNHILPLAYALMESRTESAYRDLYQLIRQTVPELDPDFFMTDYEVAQQNSILEVFPRVRLSGCLWHFARAVCRNVRSLGLHQLVRDNVNARRIVRLSLAIPLAPPARLMEALNEVVMESRRLHLQESFAIFFQYLRGTWIEGIGEAVLSVFGVRHRTNNLAECHHRNINARLVRRPNVWRFIEMLREMEDIAWRDLGRLELGQAPSRARRVSSLLNDARIRSCSRQVLNREMDLLHFLGSVSWHLDTTMADMLREREDEDRPGSPVRGPPPSLSDDVRLGPGNLRSSRSLPEFDVDFEEIQRPASNQDSYASLNASYLFDSLMEDDQESAHGSIRGRRGRRGSGRGRGRGGRPSAGRPSADRPSADRPSADRPSADRPSAGRPSADRPSADRPSAGRPSADAGIQSSSPHLPSPLPSSSNQSHTGQSPGIPPLVYRPEEFSDPEDVDENDCPARRRWLECIICNSRVGRYTVLGCGAFPLCGTCIRQWFINLRNRHCPHCGSEIHGWARLNI